MVLVNKFWKLQYSHFLCLYLKFPWRCCFHMSLVKDTLKALDDFKNTQESVWSNVFGYVKVCIFWKCIQYTIHWDKTQMLKKFPSGKVNGANNALFFLSQAPTRYSFTFNLRLLHGLKHKVRLSKPVCGIFHFQFGFVFY